MFDNWAKDPENVKYLSWQAHRSIDDTYKVLYEWIKEYKNKNSYRWCITLKDNNEVSTCEIGYVISKKYGNKGIMTETLRAVMNYLFNTVGFNRIQLRHMTENPVSGRVMVKCGMKYEGILRQYGVKNTGERCDTAIYSILKSDIL